jgi:hypothetical protein
MLHHAAASARLMRSAALNFSAASAAMRSACARKARPCSLMVGAALAAEPVPEVPVAAAEEALVLVVKSAGGVLADSSDVSATLFARASVGVRGACAKADLDEARGDAAAGGVRDVSDLLDCGGCGLGIPADSALR